VHSRENLKIDLGHYHCQSQGITSGIHCSIRVFFWRLDNMYSGDRNWFLKASSVLQTRYFHSNQSADLRLAFDF
jgi:hypothetical protein